MKRTAIRSKRNTNSPAPSPLIESIASLLPPLQDPSGLPKGGSQVFRCVCLGALPFVAASLLGTATTRAQAPTSYTFTYLGTLPGGTSSQATGINDFGTIVGFGTTSGGATHAFSTNGVLSGAGDLGTLGGTSSSALGINNSGVIVGSSTTASGATHAFRTTGALTPANDLGSLGGGTSSAAGINDSGVIVGNSTTASGATHAFSTTGVLSAANDLGTLGGSNSYATAINRSGVIVGYSFTSGDAALNPFSTTGVLSARNNIGNNFTTANAVNSNGVIVGYLSKGTYNDQFVEINVGNAFTNLTPSNLGTLGGANSIANGVNKAGIIVGKSDSVFEDFGDAIVTNPRAFVDYRGVMTNLNSLIASSTPLNGFTLVSANAINTAGDIVGYGYTSGGATQAFLLTPSTMGGASSYWTGAVNANWGTAGNWNTGVSNMTPSPVPTSNTDVYFNTTSPAATHLNTTLDVPIAINSLTFLSTATTPVTIGNGGNAANTLTIGVGGITVQDGSAAHTISANVILGASQNWVVGPALGPLTVSGAVSDGGNGFSLTTAGTGTLILSGANTYTGPTMINEGTLNVANGNALNTNALGGAIVFGGGTLQYSAVNQQDYSGRIKNSTTAIAVDTNGQNVTFASALDNTNTEGLTKSGAGALTLTGANAYPGVTYVLAGTLKVTGGGSITQTSAVIVDGASVNTPTLTLDGTAGGGTVATTGGAITVGDTGSGTLNLVNGGSASTTGAFTIGNSGNGVLNLATGGTANVNAGMGTLNLAALTGSTGALTIGNGAAAGALQAAAVTGGLGTATVNFSQTDTITFAPLITGSISLTQSGSGTTTLTGVNGVSGLTGNNTYTGATVVSAGTLLLTGAGQISKTSGVTVDGFPIGNATFTINNNLGPGLTTNGGVSIGDSGKGTLNVNSGSLTTGGNLTIGNSGSGTMNLSSSGNSTSIFVTIGSNSSGTAFLANLPGSTGVLNIGNGGPSNVYFGAAMITGGAGQATVNFNFNDAPTGGYQPNLFFGTLIAGTAAVTVTGSTPVAFGAANTYTGNTTINNGTLVLNPGSTINKSAIVTVAGTGLLQVNASYTSSTTLTGNGRVQADLVNAGKVIPGYSALGASPLTGNLTVLGTYTQASSGDLITAIHSDLSTNVLVVSPALVQLMNGGTAMYGGGATLDGTLELKPDNGVIAAGKYLIVQAGSVAGTFASVVEDVNGAKTPAVQSVQGGNLYVTLSATVGMPTVIGVDVPASGRVFVGGAFDFTGHVANLAPSGSATLNYKVSSTTPGLSGLPAGTQMRAAGDPNAASGAPFNGMYTSGTTGSHTLAITVMDANGVAPSNTSSFPVAVVDNRVVTASAVNFGRVMANQAVSAGTTLSTAGDDNSFTRVTVGNAGADANGISVTGGLNPVFNGASITDTRTVAGVFTSAGSKSGTLTLPTTGEGLTGENPINVSLSYTANPVNKRTITGPAGTTSLGVYHIGAAPASAASLGYSSVGMNSVTTSVQVAGSVTPDANGVALVGTPTALDGSVTEQAGTLNFGGAFTRAGQLSGTAGAPVVTLENGGAGLANEGAYAPVTAAYTATVFSGKALWSVNGGASWGANANWTDTLSNAGLGSPGLAGFAGDTATFDSRLGSSAVTLDGVNPSLNAISFLNNTGAITQGTGGFLTLAADASGNAPLITVTGGQNVIAAPVILAAGTNVNVTGATDSLAMSGIIGGPGNLFKSGLGSLSLSAANTYSGDTVVNQGSLYVDGSIASANAFVNANGLLGGHGTIGGNLINGGIVSPGNSPGTLTVNGNFTQTSGGLLKIEIGGLAAGQFDVLNVGGKATLGGALQLVQLNGFQFGLGQSVTFLTAGGGVSGTFSTISNPFSSGTMIGTQVIYGPNSVTVQGVQNSFAALVKAAATSQTPASTGTSNAQASASAPGVASAPGSSAISGAKSEPPVSSSGLSGQTENEMAVALSLDSALFDKRQTALIAHLDHESLDKVLRDLERISPDELTSIYQISVSLSNVQTSNLERRMDDLRSGASGFSAAGLAMSGNGPYAEGAWGYAGPAGDDGKGGKSFLAPAPDNRWGFFITGSGEFTNVSGTENAGGYDLNTAGVTLGLDYKVTPHLALGLTAGYAHTWDDLSKGGRLGVDGGRLGVYATAFSGGCYFDTAVTGGFNGYDTNRSALEGAARGQTSGGELNVAVSTGYDWKTGHLTFGPTGTFQYTYVGFDGFTERGSLAPLSYPSQNQDSLRTALGARVSYDWKVAGVLVKPELRAAWQHEFGVRSYALDSSFANGAGDPFTTYGPDLGRDSLVIGAGVAVQWNDRVATYLNYDGEMARTNYSSHSVSAGVRVAF